MEYGLIVLLVIAFIILVIFIEWKIGTAIGKAVTQGTGLALGIILILLGFTIFIAIPIIMYSSKNKSDGKPLDLPAVNLNINKTEQGNGLKETDTRECPFCAETIKKKASVCRFCGKEVSPIV